VDAGQEPNGVWSTLVRRQTPQVEAFACREYLEGSAILRLPDDRLPSLEELESVITPRTGWRLRRTPIRYSDALPWYRHFGRKTFLVTDYMRSWHELDFTPEPDMFHDIFGHLPFLVLPEYTSLLVVENPATSSPGLAFLFATIGHFGEDGYLEFWQGLVANDVKVVSDWETAFYTEFSRWGGERPIVVSYASSPPVDLIFAEEPMDTPVTAAVVSDGSCFRQIEFVGVLKGTKNRDLAEAWVDFMLSKIFQEDLPLQMFVFPVNPDAHLQPEFVNFLVEPEQTAFVSPEDIATHREEWIEAWTEVVLR